jgi:peptide/nickel transport system ATP-binding protein
MTATREPLLSLREVCVDFGTGTAAADRVTFDVFTGEVLAVVGESGSGKTVTAMSLLGLLPGSAVVTGSALLGGQELYTLPAEQLREVRGGRIGMIFQEPMSALNPVFRVGDQVVEAIRAHHRISRREAKPKALELLKTVELPDVERIYASYPHELSGGQLQRIVIAMAIANEPVLLVADEPTTALDVTVQAGILNLLRELGKRLDTAILLITHDMGVVAEIADRVVVMRNGRVVEQNTVAGLFAAPKADYTRELLDSVLSLGSSMATGEPASTDAAVVSLRGLMVTYRGRYGAKGVRAVDGVDLDIRPGEIVGLVGESGSGKTTISGAITGLVPITGGSLLVGGVDVASARPRALKAVRRQIGVVFQDPASSLNPRATIGASIAEPLVLHDIGGDHRRRVRELLEAVRLDPGLRERYPHELSGGQRQRVGIARALALEPRLLIADEPTSALDVSVQASVLELFARLQAEFAFACLFISHDLAVIERVADRVAVMLAGKIVEEGTTQAVLKDPQHEYTQRLVAAAPRIS